jgi:predicted nucleic acid-binding protein
MNVMIQIRNVPAPLHRRLKSRAALAGMSLSDYLLNEITRVAERPSLDELRRAARAARESFRDGPVRDAGRRSPRRARPSLIVVDASALIEVLLRTTAAKAVENLLFAQGETLHAPHLLDVEVMQVIRRYAAKGEIDGERGRAVLTDLSDFPLQRYPHDFLLPRVWALRNNLTAYDAVYVALAEVLDATLLTRDHRLAAAADHHAHVALV